VALSQVELYSILGVLAVLLGVIAYNNVAAARASRAAGGPRAQPAWLGKHVHFEGNVLGEVVAEDGGLLVVRRADATLAVPRSAVKAHGLDLSLTGFDRDAALAAGAAWQARQA
jgi:hypothetical protein